MSDKQVEARYRAAGQELKAVTEPGSDSLE